ncbi:hypothetical protein JYJ95_28295 [Corallococcus exiguus]|uniref:hypothetical protein n=1 Tax=Corallococcus exiguus TaxID=83462 RepID=UPI001A8ED6B1|nr:hypothetical protein [Corallococcus exiguus]MBN8470427.1 hypothetical protein [Corallococcus exiguus]
MRLFRRLAHSSLATLFVMALPFAQARAQDCVQFSGMKHCAVGAAKLVVEGKALLALSDDASGKDGVSVDTERASNWSAGLAHEPSSEGKDTTVKTVIANGKVVSTSSVTTTDEGQEFAASFVDANGKPATYSALVFLNGKLMASVSGLASGSVGAKSFPLFGRPTCTILTPKACRKLCGGPGMDCAYCDRPCFNSVNNEVWLDGNGRVPHLSHSYESPFNGFSLGSVAKAAPEIVVGDLLVLVADAPSAGEAQDSDQVIVQSTAKTVSLSDETVSHR